MNTVPHKPFQNYDTFNWAFLTSFILLTSENWNNNLYDSLNSGVNKFLSSIYLCSWIWIGNFMLLNLVLSILLDAFSEEDEEEKE